MKQVQKNFFISYTLSDQVWWCNIQPFWSYFINYICKFIQASSWHHKLFQFHLSFCIRKAWKAREKIAKNWISGDKKKSFLDEIKNNFHSFWRAIIWWKNKNLIKSRGHKLCVVILLFVVVYFGQCYMNLFLAKISNNNVGVKLLSVVHNP